MKAAVDDAAETWENAISRSNFSGGHTLTIKVGGENLGSNGFEAVAAPIKKTLVTDGNSKLLPIEGFSTVNTSPDKMRRFSTNKEYFTDVMTHELGHVMGIGTLWTENNLIDPFSGVYYGNTNAGEVYSNSGQDIPLTTGAGQGSDFMHWREEVFDNELLTHILEVPGKSNPLSSLTLASLSDIGWNVFDDAADIYPDFSTEGTFA